jgi:hypothetical protein
VSFISTICRQLIKVWKAQQGELKAIELALCSFQHIFSGKSLNWYTDNQNCVKIVEAGSMVIST